MAHPTWSSVLYLNSAGECGHGGEHRLGATLIMNQTYDEASEAAARRPAPRAAAPQHLVAALHACSALLHSPEVPWCCVACPCCRAPALEGVHAAAGARPVPRVCAGVARCQRLLRL